MENKAFIADGDWMNDELITPGRTAVHIVGSASSAMEVISDYHISNSDSICHVGKKERRLSRRR